MKVTMSMQPFFSVLIGGMFVAHAASAFEMGMPVDCELGNNCYIQNYVDHTPKEGVSDFTCGNLSYDGHKGTDFAVRSMAEMAKGVKVLAAASGTVKGARDVMPDRHMDTMPRKLLNGKECGNGLVISHDEGWETQYCHMKKGSITVKTGDVVSKGDVLGEVGLSGKTQFPHLHLSVRKNGVHYDPFTSREMEIACSLSPQRDTLWERSVETRVKYSPTGHIISGFHNDMPSLEQAVSGNVSQQVLSNDASKIIYWTVLYGVQLGDELRLKITSPTGVVVTRHSELLKKNQARYYKFIGKKNRGMLEQGTYVGEYQLLRSGAVFIEGREQVLVK